MVLKSSLNTIKNSSLIKVKKGAFEPYENMSVEDRKQFIKNRQKLSNKDKFNA
jgi:hypothetical protein